MISVLKKKVGFEVSNQFFGWIVVFEGKVVIKGPE